MRLLGAGRCRTSLPDRAGIFAVRIQQLRFVEAGNALAIGASRALLQGLLTQGLRAFERTERLFGDARRSHGRLQRAVEQRADTQQGEQTRGAEGQPTRMKVPTQARHALSNARRRKIDVARDLVQRFSVAFAQEPVQRGLRVVGVRELALDPLPELCDRGARSRCVPIHVGARDWLSPAPPKVVGDLVTRDAMYPAAEFR